MKAALTLSLAALQALAVAGEPASIPRALPGPTDTAIHEAVREVLDESRENPRRHEADTIRANKYQEFAQAFSEARVPDCLHADALKRQPPMIGPIGFSYLPAVPFVVLAKIRGKCN